MSALYSTTNNGVVSAGPFLVVSRAQGTLASISLDPSAATVPPRQDIAVQIIGNYTAEPAAFCLLLRATAAYSSSNPNLATVDTNGVVCMKGSGSATITVRYGVSAQCVVSNSAPTIVQNPLSQTTGTGSNVLFTVLASSDDVLTYQWRKNGFNLSNAGRMTGVTNVIVGITNLALADGGFYDVIVANSSGSVTSSVAV